MKRNQISIIFTSCALLACSPTGIIEAPNTGSAKATSVSLCGLRENAEKMELWGSFVEISGSYATDRSSYSWIRDDCVSGDSNGIQFTRMLTFEREDLELMKEGYEIVCKKRGFCVVHANIVVQGILEKAPESDFGMLLNPVKVVKFDIAE